MIKAMTVWVRVAAHHKVCTTTNWKADVLKNLLKYSEIHIDHEKSATPKDRCE